MKIKEQGYNPSLSLIRLSKKYSESRLESACKLALVQIRVVAGVKLPKNAGEKFPLLGI